MKYPQTYQSMAFWAKNHTSPIRHSSHGIVVREYILIGVSELNVFLRDMYRDI